MGRKYFKDRGFINLLRDWVEKSRKICGWIFEDGLSVRKYRKEIKNDDENVFKQHQGAVQVKEAVKGNLGPIVSSITCTVV